MDLAVTKKELKAIERATPEARKLYFALKEKGIHALIEWWDKHKHIDIAIPEADINIEVDGPLHNIKPQQALQDLKRTYYSFKQGFFTLRIPNSLITNHFEDCVQLITEMVKGEYTETPKSVKMNHKVRLPLTIIERRVVLNKYNGVCADCGLKLYIDAEIAKEQSYEQILECFSQWKKDMPEINIYSYFHECWKCHKPTQIMTYNFDYFGSCTLGHFNIIDQQLLGKFSTIKKTWSNTMESEVIANVCQHCGALQGNFYLGQDLMHEPKLKKVGAVPNLIEIENLHTKEELNPERKPEKKNVRIFKEPHVHHVDNNPANNDINNLILLCRDCHKKRHMTK